MDCIKLWNNGLLIFACAVLQNGGSPIVLLTVTTQNLSCTKRIWIRCMLLVSWQSISGMDSDSWIQIWHTYSCLWIFTVLLTSVRPSTPFSADTDTPIFCCQSKRYRYDTDFLIRFKSGRGAAWLTDQRLQTPLPQLITAVRRGPVAARWRMPLICRGQSNTATVSKV